jgi:1-acyl-sn-glycerol-3-phosphate acyltransferase
MAVISHLTRSSKGKSGLIRGYHRRMSNKASTPLRWFRWTRLFIHLAFAWLQLITTKSSQLAPVKRRWSAGFVSILGIRVEVHGLEQAQVRAKQSATMLASNHVSWLDIQVLDSLLPARYIAKSEIRDWPGAGWIAAKAGTIFIRREKRSDTTRINEQIAHALQQGDCVGLFPEGTTSEGDVLRRFHASLMEPAVSIGAAIQPVSIRYQRADGSLCREAAFIGEISFVQSVALIIRQREITVRVQFARPIETKDQHRKVICDQAYAAVAAQLDIKLDDAPPPSLGDLLAAQR